MRPERNVILAINADVRGEGDSALLHACLAIDGTAKRKFGSSNKTNFKALLRENYDIIEAMLGYGIDISKTKFENLEIVSNGKIINAPDLADVVYHIFRCNSAHGEDVPEEFTLNVSVGDYKEWIFEKNKLRMPDTIIWALLGVAVFSPANRKATTKSDHYLSWRSGESGSDEYRFKIRDWWGKADEFRTIISRYEQVRVEFQNLKGLVDPTEPD